MGVGGTQGVAFGGTLRAGYRWRVLSTGAELGFDAPTSRDVPTVPHATVQTFTVGGAITSAGTSPRYPSAPSSRSRRSTWRAPA